MYPSVPIGEVVTPLGLLRAELAQRLERVAHLEDVELDLVRVVADGVVKCISHPLHVVLDEALGAAVDLLEEVLGVERLQVLRSRLPHHPARRHVDQWQHRRDPLLRGRHARQLGIDRGFRQGTTGGGGGSGGTFVVAVAVGTLTAAVGAGAFVEGTALAARVLPRRSAGGAVRSISC